MNIRDLNIDIILRMYESKGYQIFTKKDFDLNIGAIRSTNSNPSEYDDLMFVFRKTKKPNNPIIISETYVRKYEEGYLLEIFKITTNPGLPYFLKPMNPKGAAIIVPGQYINVWKLGLHQGKYKALVQVGNFKVYRDNNKDSKMDFDEKSIEEGNNFGLNCHKGSVSFISKLINKNSAGCQVHQDAKKYEDVFIWTIEGSFNSGNKFESYTLFLQKDYENAIK